MHSLHYGPGTAALAVHVALEEAGAEYEAHRLDMAGGEQTGEAYRRINPKGRVPALETPKGVLTETPAILGYVARTWPEAKLLPETPFAIARADEFASYLASTVHVAHAHKMRGSRWTDDESAHAAMREKVTANMDAAATLIEEHYLAGPWVLGEGYSTCDPYLLTVTRWMRVDGVDMAAHPALAAHETAMRARPAVQRVMALHE